MSVSSATFGFSVTVGAVQTAKELPNGPYVKHTDAAATLGDAFIMKPQTSDDVTTTVKECMLDRNLHVHGTLQGIAFD